MYNIISNYSQKGGFEEYKIFLIKSFHILVALDKDRLWVEKNTLFKILFSPLKDKPKEYSWNIG